jgi:hypothetical protein
MTKQKRRVARKLREIERRRKANGGGKSMKWFGYATAGRGWLSRLFRKKD